MHPGKDNLVRVATVKISHGVCIRPVTNLAFIYFSPMISRTEFICVCVKVCAVLSGCMLDLLATCILTYLFKICSCHVHTQSDALLSKCYLISRCYLYITLSLFFSLIIVLNALTLLFCAPHGSFFSFSQCINT